MLLKASESENPDTYRLNKNDETRILVVTVFNNVAQPLGITYSFHPHPLLYIIIFYFNSQMQPMFLNCAGNQPTLTI